MGREASKKLQYTVTPVLHNYVGIIRLLQVHATHIVRMISLYHLLFAEQHMIVLKIHA